MYICTSCNYASTSKLGKCPDCGSFDTFSPVPGSLSKNKKNKQQGQTLAKQSGDSFVLPVSHKERQRLFGTWIQSWGVYLLWWEPWIGKSTLILQLLHHIQLLSPTKKLWYMSWEENKAQISTRYKRIYNKEPHISIYHTNTLPDILQTAVDQGLSFIVIDSIQTIHTESGISSIQWVRNIAHECMEFAKLNNIAILIVWHVTKAGEIAGPKYLEHIVDVVMYIQGERDGHYRTVRLQKNRFGSTEESALFEMTSRGLSPVQDWSKRVLSAHTTWSILSIALDNGRPVLIEVQALLTPSYHKHPQRTCVWWDSKRVDMIVAVLTKYCKLQLYKYDIYLNIPGETRFTDNWLDLAVAAAIVSQYKNISLWEETLFIGEIWLSWHISASRLHNKRKKDIPDWYVCTDQTSMSHIQWLL